MMTPQQPCLPGGSGKTAVGLPAACEMAVHFFLLQLVLVTPPVPLALVCPQHCHPHCQQHRCQQWSHECPQQLTPVLVLTWLLAQQMQRLSYLVFAPAARHPETAAQHQAHTLPMRLAQIETAVPVAVAGAAAAAADQRLEKHCQAHQHVEARQTPAWGLLRQAALGSTPLGLHS